MAQPQRLALLVLLTGPVGAGKSSTATAVAAAMRARGQPSAVIDLDLVYQMARQSEGYGSEATWRTARRAAGALAADFFESGLDFVVVEGGFHNAEECEDVRRHLHGDVQTLVVALNVSYEETARRVAADPAEDRVFSRDPEILSYLYRHYASALPFLVSSGVAIEGDTMSITETADAIVDRALLSRQAI